MFKWFKPKNRNAFVTISAHVQYPVKYLSRLQRILPAVRWELYFMVAHAAHPSCIQGMHATMDRAVPWAGSQGQGTLP